MALTVVQSGVGGTGNTNLTYPSTGGTVMVSGNMPAFSAYASGTTSLTNAAFTKITLNTKVFDTNTNFDTTNYRFTPTVAGYYQLNCGLTLGGYIATVTILSIYKNGAEFYRGIVQPNTASSVASVVSGLVYANGTDYFEMYAYQNSGTTQSSGNNETRAWFNGCLVRTA